MRLAIDLEILRGIEFSDVQVLVNRFGFHVVLRTNLRRNLVPRRARDNDANQLFATALHVFVQFNLRRLAFLEVKRIEGKFRIANFKFRIGKHGYLREQVGANLKFARGIFGERNTNGVAQSVAQQRADTDG